MHGRAVAPIDATDRASRHGEASTTASKPGSHRYPNPSAPRSAVNPVDDRAGRAARGDVIAFLDGNVVAELDWLERLLVPDDDPDVVGVGGAIEPLWPGDRPAFLAPEFDWVVGCTYRGMPTKRAGVRNLIGANMSFRRSVLAELGAFRDGLGRVGRHPLGREETELCIRARQARPSARIVFEPSARVHHHVSADRVTWRYFRSRCYAEGLSKAEVSRYTGSRDGLSSERAHALNALARAVAREVAAAARRRGASSLARAAAIVARLAITVAGYGVGTLQGAKTCVALRREGGI